MEPLREHPVLRPFLTWITQRHAALGGLTEVRILGGPRQVWSAFIGPDEVDATAEALQPGSEAQHPKIGQAHVYFGLNPIAPRTVTGDARFQRMRATTRDRDIRAVSLFVVDIDPVRQPPDRSASDLEKAQALAVTDAIAGWLSELGAPPLRADSGNGYHLLVPLVPAFGEDIGQAAQDARNLLRWLDQQFSTPSARVDGSMFNPARICKLYGTLAVKGTATEEHPHRWSSIELADIPRDTDLFERARVLFQDQAPPRTGFPVMNRLARSPWEQWRVKAVAALPLEAVYGAWLTGASSGAGWLQCRDPDSDTGDQHPSAGVADGTGSAERGSFHSFRSSRTESVFDFLMRKGYAPDFRAAAALVAGLSGVAAPGGVLDPWARIRLCPVEQRGALVREAARSVLEGPQEGQREQLETLRRAARIDVRSMRALVRELRAAKPTELPEKTARGRPVIDHITNRDTVEDLFMAILEAIRQFARFFRTEREIVFIRRGVGPIVVTDRNLAGLLSAFV
jgi:hypothetical protein